MSDAYVFGVCVGLWYGLAAWLVPCVTMSWFWRRCGLGRDDHESRIDYTVIRALVWLASPLLLPMAALLWFSDWIETWPLPLLLAIAVLAGAACCHSRAAPAPLKRKVGKDHSHPAWACGRWVVRWSDSYYSYELRPDGTCAATHLDSDGSMSTCAASYVGFWRAEKNGVTLCVRERYVNSEIYDDFVVPFDGVRVKITNGNYQGVWVSVKRPKATD